MASSSDDERPASNVVRAPPSSGGLRPEELPSLFWDELPENLENNADMLAIQAIIDESTPEERASNFKDYGNRALKTGLQHRKKFYLREAVDQYNKGLDLACSDASLNSVLYANRAHVQLLLGNFRNTLQDSAAAVKLDGSNVKAHYRGAKAALALRQYAGCVELCRAGLEEEPGNKELQSLAQRAAAAEAEGAARKEAEQREWRAKRGPALQLAQAILKRGWKVGRPQFRLGEQKPYLDEKGLVHWPVLFFYPEAAMRQDIVQDFCEADSFRDHLDMMFGPEAPPLEWDEDGIYKRSSVELYYLSNAATQLSEGQLVEAMYGGWPDAQEDEPRRYGAGAAHWERVAESITLADLLALPDLVIPGIPVLFVLAKGTSFRERFLEGELPLL